MSRSTQYIGLTKAADDFIKKGFTPELDNLQVLERKYNDKDIYWEKRSAAGMFDEEIPLGTWRRTFSGRDVLIREVLQTSPWSGGPMLFTCLEIDFGNGNNWDKPGDEKYDQTSVAVCFQWIDDPTVTDEYDDVTGRMWI